MPVAPLQDVLVALTDPMRLEMVRRLMSAGEALACSSLYDGISKSTASHHFKTLREAGVIERIVRGAQICQRLRISELAAAQLSELDLRRGEVRVIGKGRKERIGLLGGPALDALEEYVNVGRPILRAGARTFLSVRKHRNYRLFFTGQVVSVSGTWMQNVAMYWFVLTLTHDPFAVGILSLCRFGPFTVFGLVAGVIADRFDNRKTVMVTQSVQMALSAVLAVDAVTGHATAWHVYGIAALTGTALVLDAAVAVAQVDVQARGAGRPQLAVDAIGEQALGALAPAGGRQREHRAAQRLARPVESLGEVVPRESGLLAGGLPRPARDLDQRERARRELVELRQRSADVRQRLGRVYRPGRAEWDWTEGGLLHERQRITPMPVCYEYSSIQTAFSGNWRRRRSWLTTQRTSSSRPSGSRIT